MRVYVECMHADLRIPLRAIAWMAVLLAVPPAAAEADLAALVPRLADDDFATREAASNELLALGRLNPEPIRDFCFRQMRGAADPEVRARCRAVLLELLSDDSGFIGIRHARYRFFGAEAPPDNAVVITQVIRGLPAAAAGLVAGDIVTGINGVGLDGLDPAGDLTNRIAAAGADTKIVLTVLRQGEPDDIAVTTGRRPAEFQEIPPEVRLQEWIRQRLAHDKAGAANQAAAEPAAPAEETGQDPGDP